MIVASSGAAVLFKRREKTGSHKHSVQFYDDELVLAKNVSDYLGEGLRRGDRLVVIATPSHRESFIRELQGQGFDPAGAVQEGRLLLLDAAETLAGFMLEGQPEAGRFADTVGALIRKLPAAAGDVELPPYGEMVDVLWHAGYSSAAMSLEQLWNE